MLHHWEVFMGATSQELDLPQAFINHATTTLFSISNQLNTAAVSCMPIQIKLLAIIVKNSQCTMHAHINQAIHFCLLKKLLKLDLILYKNFLFNIE